MKTFICNSEPRQYDCISWFLQISQSPVLPHLIVFLLDRINVNKVLTSLRFIMWIEMQTYHWVYETGAPDHMLVSQNHSKSIKYGNAFYLEAMLWERKKLEQQGKRRDSKKWNLSKLFPRETELTEVWKIILNRLQTLKEAQRASVLISVLSPSSVHSLR